MRVGPIDVSTRGAKHSQYLRITLVVEHRPPQRRVALPVDRIHFGPRLQEQSRNLGTASPGSEVKRAPTRRIHTVRITTGRQRDPHAIDIAHHCRPMHRRPAHPIDPTTITHAPMISTPETSTLPTLLPIQATEEIEYLRPDSPSAITPGLAVRHPAHLA